MPLDKHELVPQNGTGRVTGKVALITGGTLGIGKATAHLFLQEGAKVVITARNEGRGRNVEKEFAEVGPVLFIEQDVASEDDWRHVIALTIESFGGLDVLVNNAAASVSQTIAQSVIEDFKQVIASNLTSVFIGMKLGAEAMLRNGGRGAIINLSSVAAGKGHAVLPAYTAAKMGVEGLTRCAALEYGEAQQPIRVNAVRPGYIETELSIDFLKAIGGDIENGQRIMAERHPIGYVGKPIDVANIILYLASDEAKFVTGSVFSIDGGYQVA